MDANWCEERKLAGVNSNKIDRPMSPYNPASTLYKAHT